MADQQDFALEVDFGDNGGKFSFTSIQEVETWFQKENAHWEWLKRSGNQSYGTETYNQFAVPFNQIGQYLSRVKQHVNSPQFQHSLTQLKNALVSTYTTTRIPHSSTPRAKLIDNIREKKPLTAIHALRFYLGMQMTPSGEALEGAFLALLHEYGLKDTAENARRSLEELLNEGRTALSDAKMNFQTQKDESAEIFAEWNNQIEEQAVQFKSLTDESKITLDHVQQESKRTLQNIAKTYEEKLSLQVSVAYWKRKGRIHGIWAIWLSIATLLLFTLVGGGLYMAVEQVIGVATIKDVEVWKLVMLAGIATVGVWIIRVLVRLLLSNMHLYTDATERWTMLLTYLAMMRKGHLPDSNERLLILQAVFRPSATGIIKDDGTPPFMAEWLKRVTGNE
ncbi:MAG TPA: hypothetical protein DCZ95_01025 [Verrucomicrobia bacterium]|nr:MAG: hypothetical protein A2X46_12075 [Lentisphaerae bacterium GWF2_57_35]HBA82650.1 hypothetical protein [Verrucomicrobiota bacterium]